MERYSKRVEAKDEYSEAARNKDDKWVAACGGNEIEFTHYGTRWLYVYNPARDEHGYLNLDTDIVQPDAPWTK